MPEYVVIRKSDRAEVHQYSHIEPVEWTGMEFATHDHVLVPPVVPESPVPTPRPWHITKRSFWNRLPQNKLLAMRAIILQGHPILLAANLEMGRAEIESSPYVDLDLDKVREQTLGLATAAVPETITIDGVTLPLRLTLAEAMAALNTPPTEVERYKGVA